MALDIHMTTLETVVRHLKGVVSIKVIVVLTENVVVPLSVVNRIVHHLFPHMQTAVNILVLVISLYC